VPLASDTWHGIRICPLIPLIMSECPRNIVREISELVTWFDRIYDANPQGLRDAWMGLVKVMEICSTGMTMVDSMETYKLVLPTSLLSRNLDTTDTFCSRNSRPVIFKGLSEDNYCELLNILLGYIF
jgi:hypothetical protein